MPFVRTLLQTRQDDITKETTEKEKARQIGEILGLLEETHRSKGWILQEIKKQGLKVSIKPTMNSYEILNICPQDFISKLVFFLKGDDIKNEENSPQTKIYHWFFSDIVAGSNPSIPTKSQVKKIIVLNELISRTETFRKRDNASTIILPTGDGMAIGFGDSPENPLKLTIELHKTLFEYNTSKRGKDKLLIRVGIESGPVFFVKDLEGNIGVWGRGILMTRRVMDLCGDMQIYASTSIAEQLVRISQDYKMMLHPIQNYQTKYGENLQLYNVYGEGFGSKVSPTKPKVTKHNILRNVKSGGNFSFNEIQIMLEVTDAKTMQTHHTWVWDVVNTSKEPKSKIFYFLDGHVPKDIADLNIKITDENNNRLEIGDITVNKPYRKELYVILDKPVLPRQRKKLKLQYDWEEPERTFLYKFPSGAKKFGYICTVPKEIDVKNRVFKVDTGTGYKVYANPPATIKRFDDKTVIMWGKSNIIPQDAYQFLW